MNAAARIRGLLDERARVAADLRTLAETTAGREMTPDEARHEGRLLASINSLDTQVRALLDEAAATEERADVDPRAETRASAEAFGHLLVDLAEGRAVNTGSGSAGAVVPEAISGRLIEMVRTRSGILASGVPVDPMPAQTVKVPKVLSEVNPAWRAESATITESSPTFGAVDLTAKNLAALVRLSRELLQDGPRAAAAIEAMFARRVAEVLDAALLTGGGANGPASLFAGITPTVAAKTWDALANAASTLAAAGHDRSGLVAVVSPATFTTLNLQREGGTTGPYLAAPNGVPRLIEARAQGDGVIHVFDPARIGIVGVREALEVSVLRERFADTGEIGFVAHARFASAQIDATAAVVLDVDGV